MREMWQYSQISSEVNPFVLFLQSYVQKGLVTIVGLLLNYQMKTLSYYVQLILTSIIK